MKLIIAGGRGFNNYESLKLQCDSIIEDSNLTITEIVSGGAHGADRLGEKYAIEKDISIKMFPADWNQHGKAAGPIRNKQMADYADVLIAFWDNKSRGTKNMIEQAQANKLKVYVIFY